jgi:hypothetical protein
MAIINADSNRIRLLIKEGNIIPESLIKLSARISTEEIFKLVFNASDGLNDPFEILKESLRNKHPGVFVYLIDRGLYMNVVTMTLAFTLFSEYFRDLNENFVRPAGNSLVRSSNLHLSKLNSIGVLQSAVLTENIPVIYRIIRDMSDSKLIMTAFPDFGLILRITSIETSRLLFENISLDVYIEESIKTRTVNNFAVLKDLGIHDVSDARHKLNFPVIVDTLLEIGDPILFEKVIGLDIPITLHSVLKKMELLATNALRMDSVEHASHISRRVGELIFPHPSENITVSEMTVRLLIRYKAYNTFRIMLTTNSTIMKDIGWTIQDQELIFIFASYGKIDYASLVNKARNLLIARNIGSYIPIGDILNMGVSIDNLFGDDWSLITTDVIKLLIAIVQDPDAIRNHILFFMRLLHIPLEDVFNIEAMIHSCKIKIWMLQKEVSKWNPELCTEEYDPVSYEPWKEVPSIEMYQYGITMENKYHCLSEDTIMMLINHEQFNEDPITTRKFSELRSPRGYNLIEEILIRKALF